MRSFIVLNSLTLVTKIAEFVNSVDLDEVAHNCPLVFEFSIWYSLDLKFFENLQTKILSSAFRLLFGS